MYYHHLKLKNKQVHGFGFLFKTMTPIALYNNDRNFINKTINKRAYPATIKDGFSWQEIRAESVPPEVVRVPWRFPLLQYVSWAV